MNVRALLLAGGAVALSGCAPMLPKPEITDRYASHVAETIRDDCGGPGVDELRAYCFDVKISGSDKEAEKSGLAATGLSDRGQAAYIAALAAKAKDTKALKADLAAAAKPPVHESDYEDLTQRNLHLVLGIFPRGGLLGPGDRLEWANVTIEPLINARGDARFDSWTMAANAVTAIDVGTLKLTGTQKLTAETGITLGGPFTGAKVGAEADNTREQSEDIKDKTRISGAVQDGVGYVDERAGWKDDLTGNATFDATLNISPSATRLLKFASLSDLAAGPPRPKPGKPAAATDDPGPTPAADVTVQFVQKRVAKPNPLCAVVTLRFAVRVAGTNGRTFTEADDAEQTVEGTTTAVQRIASAPATEVWRIAEPDFQRPGKEVVLAFVAAPGAGDASGVLQFGSKEDALAFLSWARAVNLRDGKVKNGTIVFKDVGLDIRAHPGLDPSFIEAQHEWDQAIAACPKVDGLPPRPAGGPDEPPPSESRPADRY